MGVGDALGQALLLTGGEQEALFRLARERRSLWFPEETVEVRSVIEVSNGCRQRCIYCGMNADAEKSLYTIGEEELIAIAEHVYRRGRRVLMLQSGEDGSQSFVDLICRCVEEMKRRLPELAVILCLGNLTFRQFRQLRDAGADRYILKFETSNPRLYWRIKQGESLHARLEGISSLIELGYEVGTGNIVGLPGQELEDLVNDLILMSQFKLGMGSSSLFIPGKNTPLETARCGSIDLILNYMALLRIRRPTLRIPTTSSLEKVRAGGQYLGLMAGANTVTIHDGTPAELKERYPIYSSDRFIPNEEGIRMSVERANLGFEE